MIKYELKVKPVGKSGFVLPIVSDDTPYEDYNDDMVVRVSDFKIETLNKVIVQIHDLGVIPTTRRIDEEFVDSLVYPPKEDVMIFYDKI